MKYKLINTTTNQETLCDKVTIDGFDYYVSDEEPKRKSICIAKTNAVYQNNQQSLNNKLVFLDKEVVNKHEIIGRVEFGEDSVNLPFDISELKIVIATNNPNIDVPKVVDEVEILAKEYVKGEEVVPFHTRKGFISGYNKSQEDYPFSEEDMVEFQEWCDTSEEAAIFWRRNRVDPDMSGSHNDKIKENIKKLLQLWKEQQPKIVWYE